MFTSLLSAPYSLRLFHFSPSRIRRERRQTKDHRVHCPVKFELAGLSLSLKLREAKRNEGKRKRLQAPSHIPTD